MEDIDTELARLRELYAMRVMDTPPEEVFDRVTELAARMFQTPIALVSFVDKDRQWFKSAQGLSVKETPREVSFCAHAIEGDDVFIIPDATKDSRFADNPLVTGPQKIRFYAGAPIKTETGCNLGTVCIIDSEPRPGLTADAQQALRALAALTSAELKLRRAHLEAFDYFSAFKKLATAVVSINQAGSMRETAELAARFMHNILGAARVRVVVDADSAPIVCGEPDQDDAIWRRYEKVLAAGRGGRHAATGSFVERVSAADLQRGAVQDNDASTPPETPPAGDWVGVSLLSPDKAPVGRIEAMARETVGFTAYDEILLGQFANAVAAGLEHHRLLNAARLAEARFKDFAEIASDWVWESDADYKVRGSTETPAHERLSRLSFVLGEETSDGMHFAGTEEEWRQHRNDLLAREPFRNAPYMAQSTEGTHYFLFNGRPVFVSDHFVGYRGVATDVTMEHLSRRQLERSERLQRGIIDTALDAFVQMDDHGRIIQWNPQAEKIFGWSRAEALGQSLDELIIPSQWREAHRLGMSKFLATGSGPILNRRISLTALRSDGTEFPIELTVAALKTDVAYVFNAFVRDISEQLSTQEQLRHAQKMEAVGQLTGGIAHDFNNLLTVILGNAELLSEGLANKEQERQSAHMITLAGERAATLTSRLLAYSRKQPLHPKLFNLNTLVHEMSGLLSRTLGETIEFVPQLADNLPAIFADYHQAENCLLNLAINSRDAMKPAGVLVVRTARVTIDQEIIHGLERISPGRYVMLSVSDTGVGISKEILPRVFEPFFTTKEPGKGTGLGLSMVYGFVRQSGGHVTADSEAGKGTTIAMHFPEAVGDEDPAINRDEAHPVPRGRETILLVEDNDLVRDYAVAQLNALGYRVLEAASGPDALAILQSRSDIDLLFTDIVLPGGMNGRQIAAEAVRIRPEIKTLCTSGFEGDAPGGEEGGGRDVLRKPYGRSELATAIRHALDRPRL